MDETTFNNILKINQKISDLFEDFEEFLQIFQHPNILFFNEVILKFVVIFTSFFDTIELQEEHIDILTDTSSLIRFPQANFLYRLASCINFEDDPTPCIQKESLFNDFIKLFELCCKNSLIILNNVIALNESERELVQVCIQSVNELKELLKPFMGEWSRNILQNSAIDVIPAEFSWYREGEE